MPTRAPAILVTAFEPSGDALAAAVIAQLKRDRPGLAVHALGGPKMAAAGAQLIESTTGHAVMLGGAVKHALSHRQRVKRLQTWLRTHPIDCLIPTDSPAANWSICAVVRKLQPSAKIVHLAMPQLWAWASWRIGRLRRLSDHVLCLLPFEPKWLADRGVTGTFVGHPVYNRAPAPGNDNRASDDPIRLALLPGSRRSEVTYNWPVMLDVLARIRQEHPTVRAMLAAAHEDAAAQTRQIAATRPGGMPADIDVRIGQADDVLDWCDLTLVVSGTATLQVASHFKPMVVMFNTSRLTWHLAGRWLIHTRVFALPNLIVQPPDSANAQARVVPEFVPHFGQVEPIVREVDRLVRDRSARDAQAQRLREIAAPFAERRFAPEAAAKIIEVAGIGG